MQKQTIPLLTFRIRAQSTMPYCLPDLKGGGIPCRDEGERDLALDHVTMNTAVLSGNRLWGKPLPHIVRISLSGLPLTERYRLGRLIRGATENPGRRISFVASGDRSHRLKEDGPYTKSSLYIGEVFA